MVSGFISLALPISLLLQEEKKSKATVAFKMKIVVECENGRKRNIIFFGLIPGTVARYVKKKRKTGAQQLLLPFLPTIKGRYLQRVIDYLCQPGNNGACQFGL
jgi:hypothetical protein